MERRYNSSKCLMQAKTAHIFIDTIACTDLERREKAAEEARKSRQKVAAKTQEDKRRQAEVSAIAYDLKLSHKTAFDFGVRAFR